MAHICVLVGMCSVTDAEEDGESRGLRLIEIEVIGFLKPRDR